MIEISKIEPSSESNATNDCTACTIIMPLFNRTSFLAQAFDSLNAQNFKDWALIIVDDGSTDNPLPIIKQLFSQLKQSVWYAYQPNSGPGSARKLGVELAKKSEFYAFFDSDDEWTASYLDDAIRELRSNKDIDWIFQACKRINHETGETLLETTFKMESGEKAPFFQLPIDYRGNLGVFLNNSATLISQIKRPLDAGFQNSVIRNHILDKCMIPSFRIGEDRYFLCAVLIAGYKLAFLNKVGVLYHVHESNISNTNNSQRDLSKIIQVNTELVKSYMALLRLTKENRISKVLKQEIANIYFWHLGYFIFLESRDLTRSIPYMCRAIALRPSQLKFYKTLLSCSFKKIFRALA